MENAKLFYIFFLIFVDFFTVVSQYQICLKNYTQIIDKL